eukprot:2333627-Alexandrium_andersonii.AAC.1
MPAVRERLLTELGAGAASATSSVREAAAAAQQLRDEGFDTPDWRKFVDPQFRPPEPEDREPGEWQH